MFKLLIVFSAIFMVNVVLASTDPTRPLLQKNKMAAGALFESSDKQLRLQSIIKSGEHLTAIVNDKLLKRGDRIGQFQVAKITERYVLLVSDEDELKLSMFTQVVNVKNEK